MASIAISGSQFGHLCRLMYQSYRVSILHLPFTAASRAPLQAWLFHRRPTMENDGGTSHEIPRSLPAESGPGTDPAIVEDGRPPSGIQCRSVYLKCAGRSDRDRRPECAAGAPGALHGAPRRQGVPGETVPWPERRGVSRGYLVSAGGCEAWNPPDGHAHLYRPCRLVGSGRRGRQPQWTFARGLYAGTQVARAPERVFRGDGGGHLLFIHPVCLSRMTTGLRCRNK